MLLLAPSDHCMTNVYRHIKRGKYLQWRLRYRRITKFKMVAAIGGATSFNFT